MDENERQIAARALLGRGTVGHASDTVKLRREWERQNIDAQMNGQEFPSFDVWSQQMRQPQDISGVQPK